MYVCCWRSVHGSPQSWIKGETKEELIELMEEIGVKDYFIGLDDISAKKQEWQIKSLEDRINKAKRFMAEV